jgi:hypothetical protein
MTGRVAHSERTDLTPSQPSFSLAAAGADGRSEVRVVAAREGMPSAKTATITTDAASVGISDAHRCINRGSSMTVVM